MEYELGDLLPYKLPEGWKWTRLGDFFTHTTGKALKKENTVGSLKKYITTSNIYWDYFDFSDVREMYFADSELEKCTATKGDLLICNGGDVGRGAIWNFDYDICLQNHVSRLRKKTNNVSTEYFYYIFKFYKDSGLINGKGIGISSLSAKAINELIVPLPPTLAEQQRIVSRIESLFSKLDEAKDKAQSVVDGFELRRAAILHKAFTGELTAKWRKENNPEESSEYLDKIKDKVEIRLDFKYWNNPNLPDSWCESTIGNLLYFAGRVGWKGLKAEEYTTEGPILLSVYNLNDGDEVSFNRINHITNERYDESPEIMVRKNDILLTKDGAGIGKLGYVKELPEKATINSSLLLIRPGDVANYKFIYYLLSGPALQNIVKERITGSATPHLFQRDIKEFVLPVPSLPEQQEIVRILDSVLEKEADAKETAEYVLSQIDLLKKSILARAFRGEL